MSNSAEVFSNPGGRAVAVLDSIQQANDAKKALTEIGLDANEIRLLDGQSQSTEIDSSARWFADTDELLERYKRKLATGKTLISTSVESKDQLKEIEAIYYAAGAHTMTNFGSFVTKTIALNNPETEKPIADK